MISHELKGQLGDVVESIAAIKGDRYMSLLIHTLNLQSLTEAIRREAQDPILVMMSKMAFTHLMADLSHLSGVDLDVPEVQIEFDRNLEIVRDSMHKMIKQ